MTTKILVLASNPQGTGQLRLDREIRTIADTLERAENRDKFALRSKVAVRVEDLQRSLRREEARIVHIFVSHKAISFYFINSTVNKQTLFR